MKIMKLDFLFLILLILLEYENRILNHQTDLYINYIAFFHIFKKIFKTLFPKISKFL